MTGSDEDASTSLRIDFFEVSEHVKGCTVQWQIPSFFKSLPWEGYRQQVVIRCPPSTDIVIHTLVAAPATVITFPTTDGKLYDVQVTVVAEIGGQEITCSGTYTFVAAKKLVLDRKRTPKTKVVDLTASVSAMRCIVKWPAWINRRHSLRLRFFSQGIAAEVQAKPGCSSFEIRSIPGRKYAFELRAFDAQGNLTVAADIWFRASFSPCEMHDLLQQAKTFVYDNSDVRPFKMFYRCEPLDYFDNIQVNYDGKMLRYPKDGTGQSASPINGRLEGLFFYARLLGGHLPNGSPFGDTRWTVAAHQLFHPDRHRLFFADFYCTYQTHYITLVIVPRDSEDMPFCERRLVELDPFNNPFFHVRILSNGFVKHFVDMSLWLEFYFADNLSLHIGSFSYVEPWFAGRATVGGLPNNKLCRVCNLYPLEMSLDLTR